jgi:hypothetical protein
LLLTSGPENPHAGWQSRRMEKNQGSRFWRDPAYWIGVCQLLIAVLAILLNR